MSPSPRSFRLTDLSWSEVRAHLAKDPRLIVPVGTCEEYGPHLPIGSATLVVEAVAATLSRDFGVLRAPTIPYGVNFPRERPFPGSASLREKTLHSLLNDLLACWGDDGFAEFILITAHNHDPHVEAIATVSGVAARVRVLEILSLDFSAFRAGEPGPEHAGEIMTSLMLHLHPDKVNLERVEDYSASRLGRSHPPRRITRLPVDSLGAVGQPSLASAETGRRVFEHIVQKIRARVFLDAPGDD